MVDSPINLSGKLSMEIIHIERVSMGHNQFSSLVGNNVGS